MPLDFPLAFGAGITQAQASALYKPKNVVQYSAPATGATVAVTVPNTSLILEPAATLAALTVNMPSSPADGDEVRFSSTQIVTVFTIGAGTIVGAITSLAIGSFASYVYRAANTSWYRIG